MKPIRLYCCVLFILLSSGLSAQIKLPRLISNSMVLQRETVIPVWGWAENADKITVEWQTDIYETTDIHQREWKIELPPAPAGGPFTLIVRSYQHAMDINTVNAGNDSVIVLISDTTYYSKLVDSVVIEDILIGDVWVASGQSNMEMSLAEVERRYKELIELADNPYIRYFDVPVTYSFHHPKNDFVSGRWTPVSQEYIRQYSALAYFFAEGVYEHINVPVGIIEASLGGSPAEAWISEERLKDFPYHYAELQRLKKPDFVQGVEMSDQIRTGTWYATARKQDSGYADKFNPWYLPGTHYEQWNTLDVPGLWNNTPLDGVNGIVWFAKTIQLPAGVENDSAEIELGAIVDADSVFINGHFIGTTSYMYPPRLYKIPAGTLKEGDNNIVVRVISNIGNGGFVKDKPYELRWADEVIDLSGSWYYKLGTVMKPLKSVTFFRWKPAGLYNDMLFPITRFPVKGVIWYQGESNTVRPMEYYQLLLTMIENWRADWQQPNLPFLMVQLANYMESKPQPSESYWAHTRASQAAIAAMPGIYLATAIDLGEWNDIHPLNKKDLADRLVNIARKEVYGEQQLVAYGPVYDHMEVTGDTIVLHFRNIGSGLTIHKGGQLKHFAIAGADQKFVWAEAWIEGETVKVYSPSVKNPLSVRYAWADNPEGANLYNKEGLPAFPFRTDDWAFIP